MTDLRTSVLETIGACCPRLKELEVHVYGSVPVDSDEGDIASKVNRERFSQVLLSRRYMPLLARACDTVL